MLNSSSSINIGSQPDNNNNHNLTVLDAEPVPDCAVPADLQNLLGNRSLRVKEERALIQRRTVEPVQPQAPPSPAVNPAALISAPPALGALLPQRLRNGKIARLPKLERDMVNKLLHNHIPYAKIVWALSDRGITVTERNISNWRTRGGYNEWCVQQDNQLRLAHLQDHLDDYLRQHDAQQLPEVGLQVASTQLTSLLMNPQTAAPLLADPNKYAKVIDALDKCSVRLNELQQQRYQTAKRASIRNSIPNLRHEQASEIDVLREIASAEGLAKSAREDNVPHRNDLPPREQMPYCPPGPTFGEMLEHEMSRRALASKPQPEPQQPLAPSERPSNVSQTASDGNPQ
ncbi:MAG TPA: hypothetical protein VG146_08425 [Verrucomicrobiae bacterium]|nr:hypothetical protein [Verrucomicrobiae bacterium]